MLDFKRYHMPNWPYFVTTVTLDRKAIFRKSTLAQIAVDNLAFYESRGDYELHAFVVMPDHMHILLTPHNDTISDVMRNIKSFIAKQVRDSAGTPGSIWQPSFHDRVVRVEAQLHAYYDYIHWNPVAAGLCALPKDYPFSSARA